MTSPSMELLNAQRINYVVRTLLRMGIPAADAEDVAQDVFVIAVQK